jgi:hypothetical protein
MLVNRTRRGMPGPFGVVGWESEKRVITTGVMLRRWAVCCNSLGRLVIVINRQLKCGARAASRSEVPKCLNEAVDQKPDVLRSRRLVPENYRDITDVPDKAQSRAPSLALLGRHAARGYFRSNAVPTRRLFLKSEMCPHSKDARWGAMEMKDLLVCVDQNAEASTPLLMPAIAAVRHTRRPHTVCSRGGELLRNSISVRPQNVASCRTTSVSGLSMPSKLACRAHKAPCFATTSLFAADVILYASGDARGEAGQINRRCMIMSWRKSLAARRP